MQYWLHTHTVLNLHNSFGFNQAHARDMLTCQCHTGCGAVPHSILLSLGRIRLHGCTPNLPSHQSEGLHDAPHLAFVPLEHRRRRCHEQAKNSSCVHGHLRTGKKAQDGRRFTPVCVTNYKGATPSQCRQELARRSGSAAGWRVRLTAWWQARVAAAPVRDSASCCL
jgi:hypothetical protein